MAERPKRIQLSRAKGWRMPPNTMNVARGPGRKWGNPYAVKNGRAADAVRLFRDLFEKPPSLYRHTVLSIASGRPGSGEGYVLDMRMSLPTLRGKNLACWCRLCDAHADGKPLGVECPDCAPCHADVLLELANK